MNGVVQDLRFALRQIWRKPGFTLIDKLILKSLPVRQPEQLSSFVLSPFYGSTIEIALRAIAPVIVLAAYFPARRAAKIDPMAALRCE